MSVMPLRKARMRDIKAGAWIVVVSDSIGAVMMQLTKSGCGGLTWGIRPAIGQKRDTWAYELTDLVREGRVFMAHGSLPRRRKRKAGTQ